MPKIIPGPPYHFVCKNCGHKFRRSIKFGLICPKCRSLKVVADRLWLK